MSSFMGANSSIAAIVPLYNRESVILDTLDAVLRQTRPPDALIVVDDASPDQSARVVERWLRREKPSFPARLLKHKVNKGAAAARNYGLSYVRDQEFVWFLDSDDVPSEHFIEKSLQTFERASGSFVAVSCDRIMKSPGGERMARVDGLADNPFLFIYKRGAGISSCTVIRTQLVKELGGYNESILTGHDTDLFIRLAKRGSWGHAKGCTVSFLCRENEFHLRGRYADYPRRWASAFEFFLDNYDIRDHIDYDFVCKKLGFRWRAAALYFMKLKAYDDAAHCLRRSLAWWPSARNASWLYLFILAFLRRGIFYDYFMKRVKTAKDS